MTTETVHEPQDSLKPLTESDVEKGDLKAGLSTSGSTLETGSYHIDPVAEKRLVRKQDLLILPAAYIAYLLVFIDRTNLGNARVAGLEASLGLRTNDFNIGACLYYVLYLVMEVPAILLVRRFGFQIIPFTTFSFGVVTLGTAFIHNRGAWFVVRILLGVLESFSLPAIAYLLSRYYRRAEITMRIAFYFLLAGGTSQAFGGLLASGFLSVSPIGILKNTWRNIFLCEGIMTMGLALSMVFWFPTDPTKTRIFNEEERKLSVARFFVDQPAVTELKEPATVALVLRALRSPVNLAMIWLYICDNLTFQGLSIFTSTILKSVYPSKTAIQIQLYTVPPAVVATAFAFGMAYIAMKFKKHAISTAVCVVMGIVGYALWVVYLTEPNIRYAALFLTQMGAFGYGPIVVSWAILNASPDTVRAVTPAYIAGFGSIGSIVSTWSFLPSDADTGYRIGNILNLATGASAFVTAIGIMYYMKWENKARASGLRNDRLERSDVHLLGSLHPEFRYIY